jgi:ankyrin repeat protein
LLWFVVYGLLFVTVAASKGHGLAVSLLLWSGAQPNAENLAGSSALLEAARGGHDETMQ